MPNPKDRFAEIAAGRASPPEFKTPNAETRAAMAEAEEIVKAGKARFASADDMFAELEKTGGRRLAVVVE